MPSNLRIDPDHLWSMLMETAKIGVTPKGGINRQALTHEDGEVRAWFKREAEVLGAQVTVDEVGNMFAVRPGKRADLAPIALGSHLDTQPTGGRFDGVLGVLGGLEALRSLAIAGYQTNAPIAVVNWTNEEGARFATSMQGSAFFAGAISREEADAVTDPQGVSFGEALDAIGWRGQAGIGARRFSAYFELHIEQGPILEQEGKTIGVVTGIQGVRWFALTLTGRDSHSGTTPMGHRADALAAAARLTLAARDIARENSPHAVATVGRMLVAPNSPNVIPGAASMTVDMRDPSAKVLDTMETALRAKTETVAAEENVAISIVTLTDVAPVHFDAACIDAVRSAAEALDLPHGEMMSGAGHDALYVARVAPTAMIFVPCKDGLSHNEAESASSADCAAGAQVLLEAALAFDATLAPS